jgi:transposase-like protein
MDLKQLVDKLSTDEREELLGLLELEINVPKFAHLPLAPHKDEAVRCPHCSGQDIYGHGTYKGRRRYRCKSCKKSFNDFTGTAVSGIKKTEKFEEYLNLMVESLIIRKASACLGVNMKTVFDWRHKILSSLSALNGGVI